MIKLIFRKVAAGVILLPVFIVISCSKNVQVASVELEKGKNAAMFIDSSETAAITDVQQSIQAGKFAVLTSAGGIYVWSTKDGSLSYKITSETHAAARIKVSPDGKILGASGADDGSIRLYDINDGSLLKSIDSVSDSFKSGCLVKKTVNLPVRDFAFSNDGKFIFAGDSSGNIRKYSIDSGKALVSFKWHAQDAIITEIRIDPSGKFLAVGGGETHTRQEARTGTTTYCCAYSNGVCSSYCTQTYTYYVTVVYYYPVAALLSADDGRILASKTTAVETTVADMEFAGDLLVADIGSDGIAIMKSRGETSFEPYSARPGGIASITGKKWLIVTSGGSIHVRDYNLKEIAEVRTGTASIFRPDYIPVTDAIFALADNGVRFWSRSGKEMGFLSVIGGDEWIFVRTDGCYSGTEKGSESLYWKIGDQKISLNDFGGSFSGKGFVSDMYSGSKTGGGINIAKNLAGKVGSVSGSEIVVYTGGDGGGLKIGDRLFLLINDNKVEIEVFFPMMTSAKCRLKNSSTSMRSYVKPGLPVFRE